MGFGRSIGGFFKSSFKFPARPLSYDTLLTGMPAPGLMTYKDSTRDIAKEDTEKANAEAAATIKQTEFEASKKAGLERLALKRRKGFAASMIVEPGSALGSSSTLGS